MVNSILPKVTSKLLATVVIVLSLQLTHSQKNSVAAEKSDSAGQQSTTGLQDLRKFTPEIDGQWVGQGISYGPYREGQAPHGEQPSVEQLTEDLQLLSKHWSLLRMYGTGATTEEVLRIIREEKLPLRVLLGAWITKETASDSLSEADASVAKQANEAQVADAIRLANSYPDEVIAISVGNETQVFWSDHITDPNLLVQYIKEVRKSTKVPVTTADDFNFWNKPESKKVADEVDFIITHVHALWAGLLPENAMDWTTDIYAEICKHHPNKMVVIGEAGWATQVHNEGEQAKLIKGEANEKQQKYYYQQFTDWAKQESVCTFFFEAFDEPWKGGPHPNEVEKHWGLFNVDRTPKAAMRGD